MTTLKTTFSNFFMIGLFETKEEVKLYSFIAGRVNIRVCTYLNMFFTSDGLSR